MTELGEVALSIRWLLFLMLLRECLVERLFSFLSVPESIDTDINNL